MAWHAAGCRTSGGGHLCSSNISCVDPGEQRAEGRRPDALDKALQEAGARSAPRGVICPSSLWGRGRSGLLWMHHASAGIGAVAETHGRRMG